MTLSFTLKACLIISFLAEAFSVACGNFACNCDFLGFGCCSDNCCSGDGSYYSYGSCKSCEPGYYCVNRGGHRAPCGEGSYNPHYGRTGCIVCSAGYYCPFQGMPNPISCPPGNFCAQGARSPTLCYGGYYCPGISGGPTPCWGGTYCPAGTAWPINCPPGNYCSGFLPTYTQCPAGYYCPSGSVLPTLCPEGMYSSAGASQCLACPRGYYCPGTTRTQAIPCGKGNYCPMGASLPIPCPAGTYSPITDAIECISCVLRYFSESGQSSCTLCSELPRIRGIFSAGLNFTTHWTGGPLASQCNCEIGWSGTNCEIRDCSSHLPGLSLGSLLLHADPILSEYTRTFNSSKEAIRDVNMYLFTYLSSSVDISGDGNITRTELINALRYRGIYQNFERNPPIPLWCRRSSDFDNYCYDDYPDVVQVSNMREDAMNHYLYTPKHYFDGSGGPLVSNMSSTYPNASWTIDECKNFHNPKNSAIPGNYIFTQWNYNNSNYMLNRTCGYVNGLRDVVFRNDDLLLGKKSNFTDNRNLTTYPSFRRVYCLSIIYTKCLGTVDAKTGKCIVPPSLQKQQDAEVLRESYECSTGLFYDGTPLDLQPSLTSKGITFSYLDTSYCETEFDVFAGDFGSADESKDFIVGINYPSYGCGRTSRHVSFVDTIHSMDVGSVVEYGVKALQCGTTPGVSVLSNMSIVPYRIPFLVNVGGFVQTLAGVGVKDVMVSFCHIDPNTGKNDENLAYCPHKVFYTDIRGYFGGEIRVSNPKWTNIVETFNITAYKEEILHDGTILKHEFKPPFSVIPLNHAVGVAETTIVDNTAVNIFGKIIFDPSLVDGYTCPFAQVPVIHVSDSGIVTEKITDAYGNFNFSITRDEKAVVYIPSYQGHEWKSTIITIPIGNETLSTVDKKRRLLKSSKVELVMNDIYVSMTDRVVESQFAIQANESVTTNTTMSPSASPVTVFPTISPVTVIPTISPSSSPTIIPTYIPTIIPSLNPTEMPSMKPTIGPTISPSALPTIQPSFIPTNRPSTSTPTVYLTNSTEPQLMHVFTFNDEFPNGIVSENATIRDLVGNTTAILHGVPQVIIKDGKAIFSHYGKGYQVPYIKLPYSSLGVADIVSIELWIEFDASNDPLSTLFSFGIGSETISYKADFTGKSSNYHIVVVYNAIEDYGKVYLNGILVENIVFNSDLGLLGGIGTRLHDDFDFIGRSANISTHGLRASIDEFRIWYGELNSTTVYSNYIIGIDQSHIVIPAEVTQSNINITFYATSTQHIRVGLYGGASIKAPMFGSETQFLLKPVDPMCQYSALLPLKSISSSVTRTVAAMNYTISLYSAPSAPSFKAGVCDPSTGLQCYCDVSQPPLNFLKDANEDSQNITITNVTESIYELTFIYRTGVCFQLLNSQSFLTTELQFYEKQNAYCFPNGGFMMKSGDNYNVTTVLFERYPEDNAWVSRNDGISGNDIVIDKFIENATVTILDTVSGASSPRTYDYNTTQVITPPSRVRLPVGHKHTINAGDPLLTRPYSLSFRIFVSRDSPGIPSVALDTWFIPVTGSVPEEVPAVYPIAVDPTLIFLVIRDPPGGGSYTTVHAGTEIEFDMSVSGMDTNKEEYNNDGTVTLGYGQKIENVFAPFGFGPTVEAMFAKSSYKFKTERSDKYEVSRQSTTNYKFSFNFEYDFSTSTDPYLAGHASDVIVGGGVDIIATEARNVYQIYQDKGLICLADGNTNVWHPGKVTTFILPVIEIELLIEELSEKLLPESALNVADAEAIKVNQQLIKQVNNWKKVLVNYRSHNEDIAPFLSVEAIQYNNMVTTYNRFKSNGGGLADLERTINENGMNGDGFHEQFLRSFSELVTSCNVNGQNRIPFKSVICTDFDTRAWNSLYDELNGACTMPDIPNGVTNLLGQSTLLRNFCKSSVIQDNDVPGGLPQSLYSRTSKIFGFLEDSNKYITFSSNSPVTLKWTSQVTDSLTFFSENKKEFPFGNAYGSKTEFKVLGLGPELELNHGNKNGLEISIGKDSSTTHHFDRSVTVNLDDNDQGDYFAVRITEDPVYGTPVFTTMGGQSKCPGESSTSRRESNVKIQQIIHRCGVNKNGLCTSLAPGETAHFGVIIYNNSPTGDAVDYTLQFVNTFDDYNLNGYSNDNKKPGYCGTPGQRSGLVANFAMTDLKRIPYNKLVEIPFSIIPDAYLCNKFNDIGIEIVATCEIPNGESEVYQYATTYDPTTIKVTIDYSVDNIRHESSSSATFSVGWSSTITKQSIPYSTTTASSSSHDTPATNTANAASTPNAFVWKDYLVYIMLFLNVFLVSIISLGYMTLQNFLRHKYHLLTEQV